MSVHYKFKSALDYDTVTFDGLHISVGDLKAAISQQKRIGKTSDFDLQITNAQTKEVYVDDNTLIPKNTSLLVARVPLSQQPKKQWEGSNSGQSSLHKDVSVNKGLADLSRMEGSEQDKINAMISQSTFDYDPSNYQKIRGQNQRGIVPSNYICYKCQKKGHWIKDCPAANSGDPIEIRRSTGIPRSFMVPVDGPKAPGAMMTPSGTFAVPAVDHEAYLASESAGGADTPSNAPVAPEPTIPDELICSLCRDLLTDAVMIPCCGNSFCDECIRGALLESEDHECPDCREKEIAPTTLIPNRFLRNSVSAFRNQTGYSRRTPHRPSAAPPVMEPPPVAQPPPINGPMQQAPGNNVDTGAPGPANGELRDRESRESRDSRDARNEHDGRYDRDTRDPRGGRDMRGSRKSRDSRRPRDRRRRGDESDGSADDNITVTVPPAHRAPPYPPDCHRLSRYGPPGMMKPGIDAPLINMPRMDEQRASTPTIDERRDPMSSQVLYNRGPPPYMPGVPPPSHFNPGYGRVGPYERFPPEPFQPPPPGIKDSPNGHEDPLEAFNRMIREKEMRAKRREERRRAHTGSRSPSRSRTPRSTRSPRSPRSRSPRSQRSLRSQRSPRSPRPRPRSRASSRIRYSRSRSMSRSRLRRSPWSPRRRRTRERTLSLTRSPSPRRRHRSPMRYRSPLRSPVRSPLRSPIRSPIRSPVRSPIRPLMSLPLVPPLAHSPVRSPRRPDMRSPPRTLSPHRYAGLYDELLSPPRRPLEPPFGSRYPSRNNGPPSVYPPIGGKSIPPMIPPQNEPPPGYRGRFDAPPFEDIAPGVEPPVPGFEPSPFEKPAFGPPGSMERDRLLPPNYRDPYRAPYVEGPPVYRDVPGMPPVQSEIPTHIVDHSQRYRDNFRPPGHSYRDQGPVTFRDGQPFRDQGPQPPYRDSNFRGGPPSLFRDNNYRNNMFRDGSFRENAPHNFRDGGVTFRPPSADPREPIPALFHDTNYREGYREDNNLNREARSGYRSNPRHRGGSRRNPNAEHERHREGRDRERLNDNREPSDRSERPREVDKRSGFEKNRDPRDDRMRDYDRIRDEKERDRAHEKMSPEKKTRVSPKRSRELRERKRSESRGRSRDRENRREKKEVRDKTSADRSRDHKEKDKKIKDRKKKKREKEKDLEKKRKREKKEKKEKDGSKKEDDNVVKSDSKEFPQGEMNEDFNQKVIVKNESSDTEKLNDINAESLKPDVHEKEVKDDLYGDEAAEAVDKEIIQNYVKSEEKDESIVLDSNKDEPFDGIELQAATDELEADIEGTNNNKEMLAPLPALSKWEVDDENIEKLKEPGEITSPEEEEDGGKVTSEVLKRAENAIFAKAINSLRPIEIKKISNDRLKLYGDDNQQKNSLNNIQITVPVVDQEQRVIDANDRKKRSSKTPPPRLSVKDRLGGKVDEIRRIREPRLVQSTVERVKSRSKTPKQEQMPYRRVTVERDRSRKPENLSRVEVPKSDRRNPTGNSKSENYRNNSPNNSKKDSTKSKGEKKHLIEVRKDSRSQEKNVSIERKKSHETERKKSTLDEAHFEPDYDENVESDTEVKDDPNKKRERSLDASLTGASDSKKAKFDNETIKLDLANVKKKPESDSESSSDSEYSSSSSSSDARKRKKKKKRNKKKKKRAASDSDSDSDTSSDDHKKKKKKRKHKKKSSKKKKKNKHK